MAYLPSTATVVLRAPVHLAASSRRRSVLPTAISATANPGSTSPHPILSSLRLAASAAVLLAATSPALACAPPRPAPTPPPASLTVTVSPDDAIPDDSQPFEKLIVETAALARFGGADAARARLSAAGGGESCARLLDAQALFVDGRVDEAISGFEELAREDPGDYRPLFCQGVLYLVLGRVAESDSLFERCREVAGDKFNPDLTILANAAVEDAGTEAAKVEEVEEEQQTEAVKG